MARPTIQSADYKFVVTQEPWVRNNKPTGFFGNFREDTGECLGVTTEQYGLIQNEALLEAAEQALEIRGLTDYKRQIVVAGAGERLYAEYTFANKHLASAVGDVFGYRLTLRNSFDRSLRAAFALGFLRLTCTNGASTLDKEFSLTKKHSSNVNIDFVGGAIDSALANGQEALKTFDLMASVKLSDEQGQNVLKHLEAHGLLSGVLRQNMETLWLAPKRQEDKARNVYNLYNAVTDYLSHQVKSERFEYAEKTNNGVLFFLYNAARNPVKLAKVITPLKTDIVIS